MDIENLDPKYYCFRIVDSESDALCVVFSARGSKPGSFSFFKTMERSKVNVLHITPPEAAWYQSGLVGFGNDIHTAFSNLWDFIQSLIEKFSFKRIFIIGDSMGAYAALVFAHFVKDISTRVICFGGETTLNLPGSRSSENVFKNEGFHDIRNLEYGDNVNIIMIFGEYDMVDAYCALSMKNRKNFKILSHLWSPHSVTPELHSDMGLANFMRDALRGRFFYPGRGHLASALNVKDVEPLVFSKAGSQEYIDTIKTCVRRYPNFSFGWLALAEYFTKAGETEKARNALKRVVQGWRLPKKFAEIKNNIDKKIEISIR